MSDLLDRYYSELNGAPAPGTPEDQPVPDGSASSQSLSNMQKGASVASAVFSIAGAASEAREMRRAAGDQLIAAEAEETAALRSANEQTRALLRASGRLRVAAAASGVDLGSASVKQLDRELRDASAEARSNTKSRGFSRARQRRGYARRLAANAAEAFGGQVASSVAQMAETFGGS